MAAPKKRKTFKRNVVKKPVQEKKAAESKIVKKPVVMAPKKEAPVKKDPPTSVKEDTKPVKDSAKEPKEATNVIVEEKAEPTIAVKEDSADSDTVQDLAEQNTDGDGSKVEEGEEATVEDATDTIEPEADEKKGSTLLGKIIYMLVIIVITALITGVGVFLFMKRAEQEQGNAPVVTTAPEEPTKTQEPTKPVIMKELYPIKVLNGSGIPGEAAKLKKLLEDDGYKVLEVGNADATNRQQTVIATKKDTKQAFLEELEKFLTTKTYATTQEVSLKDSETTSVIITIGSKRLSE